MTRCRRSLIERVDAGRSCTRAMREPEVGGQVREVTLRDRPRSAVADRGQGLARGPFDLAEVVVPLAHFLPHGGVGRPRPSLADPEVVLAAGQGRRRQLAHPLVQRHQVLEGDVVEAGRRAQVGQPQGLIAGVLLHVGQRHLQLGPSVRSGAVEQVGRIGSRAPPPAG